MSLKKPTLLLINPWIYDVAAYDFFARPLGLLYLAGFLETRGFEVHLIDCLAAPHARPGPFGTGRYPKEILSPPPALAHFPRRYGRYGISEAEFREKLAASPPPAAILITSLMTYWYPGVAAAIRLARKHFPDTPVLLGGVYATLCPHHARRHSGADLVLSGPGEKTVLGPLASILNLSPSLSFDAAPEVQPYPALHLAEGLPFIPLLTSRGCPFSCPYCASGLLSPRYHRRSTLAAVEELLYWRRRLNLNEVAFYDDALLVEAEKHLLVILEELARRGAVFRFHTPNGLHARFIDRQVAGWLRRARFATLRLGVETAAPGNERLDEKLQEGELEAALRYLQEAGFSQKEIGVYLLIGLPNQEDAEVIASIRQVRKLGATPVLALYSPIPGTRLWPQALAASPYDLEHEPLYHNNSLFPCWPSFSWERYTRLKRLAQGEEM
ncbi:MAG: B12-binding domain-containing radical SAM protein [Desulfobaccales bacterium]